MFGSYGWSGEAVDEIEGKLKDGGYSFAFKPIKVKFKPDPKVRYIQGREGAGRGAGEGWVGRDGTGTAECKKGVTWMS